MQGEREQSRDQTEGSGKQPPMGQQDDNRRADESGQQTGGQTATGEASAGGTGTLNEGVEPDLGGTETTHGFVGSQDEDPGEYLQRSGNPESGFAEQGRGAPDQGDVERTGERSENRDSDIEGGSGAV